MPPTPPPQQISSIPLSKYKFLTRNLLIKSKTSLVFRKACVKRFAIKNFIDQRSESNNGAKDPTNKLFKASAFKSLQSISLWSVSQDYLHSHLKTCKRLKSIHITSWIDVKKASIICKKLPTNVQMMQLKDGMLHANEEKSFCEFAKTILRFPKLQYFNREAESSGNEKDLRKELQAYNLLAPRLKELKQTSFGFSSSEDPQFQDLMKKGHAYSGINKLIMNLELDYLFHQIGREVFRVLSDDEETLYADIPYDLNDKEHAAQIMGNDPNTSEERLNQMLTMKHRMKEEIEAFFRFELFPNLKKLQILQDYNCVYTLTTFIGDGFQALKKLQELRISFESRSENTMYLFKQLAHLPLLRKFSLNLPYVNSEEWMFLEQFLQSQKDLEAFSLCLAACPRDRIIHLEQNASLENIIKVLADKPLLKSLELQSPFWSLETLSNGLSYRNLANKLHSLSIQGSDDIITSDTKPQKRVEGLCNFLKNQSKSLKTLKISLLFVLDDQIVNNIAAAISHLSQLRELEILINSHPKYEVEDFVNYFVKTLQQQKKEKKIILPQKWAPNIAKHLQNLENLEDFTVGFENLGQIKEEPLEWFLDLMKVLPELKWLRRLRILPRALFTLEPVEEKLAKAVLQMKNVREIAYEFDHYFELVISFAKLKEAIGHLNRRQSLRSDLMFEVTAKDYALRYIYL